METTQLLHKLKFLTLGDHDVGKSSLSSVFLYSSMKHPFNHTGIDFLVTRKLKVDDKTIKIMIWEIPRQYTRYRELNRIYCKRTNGVLLVYDVTNRQSFDTLRDVWYQKVCDHTDENTQCILVGNKCDLESERQVDSSIAKEFADRLRIPFIETSAKDNINVELAFMTLAAMVVRNTPNEVLESTSNCQLGRDRVVNQRPTCSC
eukprot:TRINITY_DN3095_c0_g1_i2.p1 TRINITY_DN3095_c0_g1~~TRINITY_DN3095_c0_g1_i2.p1  ORF type:complete len:204 (-),score=13.81 TRINITY_DN3095_c0_g1_i2:95-706(-)